MSQFWFNQKEFTAAVKNFVPYSFPYQPKCLFLEITLSGSIPFKSSRFLLALSNHQST